MEECKKEKEYQKVALGETGQTATKAKQQISTMMICQTIVVIACHTAMVSQENKSPSVQ